jgi:uncharacterized sporulation protein YeaH/YhbH (DUF444 family)
MLKVAKERYPTDGWNIYAAQASDGDNYGGDSARCVELLEGQILPMSQYFAYIEVADGATGYPHDSDLWQAYSSLAATQKHLAVRRVNEPGQIFNVFHELFAKERPQAA